MRKRLQQVLSFLCVLALAFGCAAIAQADGGIATVRWADDNNADGLRPDSVTIGSATLNVANGWTAAVDNTEAEPEVVPGYTASKAVDANGLVTLTYTHVVNRANVVATVIWNDQNNVKGVRPSTLPIRLMENGNPYTAQMTAGATNGWKVEWLALPTLLKGTMENAVYTVSAPEVAGYSLSIEGLTATYTLETGKLSLNASVTGAPEGTDLSGLQVRVTGPDSTMPRTLTWGQISAGPVDLGDVIPGTYLVEDLNADTLVEDYVLSGSASRVADAVQVKAGEASALRFTYVYTPAVAVDPANTPDPAANQGNLRFEILGPDPRMPMTVTFSNFVNGQYETADLGPGSYTVVERNAETLVDTYTLRSDSVTGMHLAVTAGGTATATLYNHYTPAPTP